MKVIIKDQSLTVSEAPLLVSNSINTYYVTFEFDQSWDGFDKTVVFNNGIITKEIVPEENCCALPDGCADARRDGVRIQFLPD